VKGEIPNRYFILGLIILTELACSLPFFLGKSISNECLPYRVEDRPSLWQPLEKSPIAGKYYLWAF